MERGEKEVWSAVLGQDYRVLKDLSTDLLILMLCKSHWFSFGHAWPPFRSQYDQLEMGCNASTWLSVFASCGHMVQWIWTKPVTPPSQTAVRFFHVTMLGLGKKSLRALWVLWSDPLRLQEPTANHRHGTILVINICSFHWGLLKSLRLTSTSWLPVFRLCVPQCSS